MWFCTCAHGPIHKFNDLMNIQLAHPQYSPIYKMCKYWVVLQIHTIMQTVVQYQSLLVLSYNWQGVLTSGCSAVEATVHDVMQMVLK